MMLCFKQADTFVRSNATNALMAIAEQIKVLQEKAKQVNCIRNRWSRPHYLRCNVTNLRRNVTNL